MALGAKRTSIFKLILNQGLTLGVFGVAAGLVICVAVTRLLASLLFGVSPTDPSTLAGFSVLLIAVVAAACIVPARKATRVNPIVALSQE